jgi:hypothetical protein
MSIATAANAAARASATHSPRHRRRLPRARAHHLSRTRHDLPPHALRQPSPRARRRRPFRAEHRRQLRRRRRPLLLLLRRSCRCPAPDDHPLARRG